MGVDYYLKVPKAKIAFSLGRSNLFGEPEREIELLDQHIERGLKASGELWEEEFESKPIGKISSHDFAKLFTVQESFENIFDVHWRSVFLVYLIDEFFELDWEIVSEHDFHPAEESDKGWRTLTNWGDVVAQSESGPG